MRILIAAGGTGGHVYPALAVAEAMGKHDGGVTLTFAGNVGGFERPLIAQSGVEFVAYDEVQAGPIHGVNPLRMASSLVKLTIGTGQAFQVLGKHKPQAILSTGGWVSLPIALAAWVRRIPMLIFLPDIEPGLTIKTLRLFAKRVALTVPESAQYFRDGQTVVTGYPLRQAMLDAAGVDGRAAAIRHFDLDPAHKTLLVFGGSRGARAINIGVVNILPQLLDAEIQVIHVTGTLDAERTAEQVKSLGISSDLYHPFAYLHDDMGLSMSAADLVVCRAGASTLAEFPLFGLPSILIPLAYSWRYQQVNADYLAERGAAIHLPEEQMNSHLLPTILDVLGDSTRLDTMQERASALATPDGALNVARELARLAGKSDL